MNPTTPIPSDLSGLDTDALDELLTQLGAEVDTLAEQDTEDATAAIEALAEAKERIEARKADLASEAADRDARRKAALGKLKGEPADDAPVEPVAETETPEPVDETVTPEPVEPTAEAESADEGLPVAIAAAVTAAVEATVAAMTAGGTEPVERTAGQLTVPGSVRPKPSSSSEGGFMKATALAAGHRPGDDLKDPSAVAHAIAKTRESFGRTPVGIRNDYVIVASGSKVIEDEIGADIEDNFGVFRRVGASADAIVASGAFCTPQTPLYDFFQVAEAQSPVEDKLPTVQAPRGGIRFIAAVDNRALALDGIAIMDEADIDPDDDSTWKPCVRVDCPDIAEEVVSGISRCVTFGNLQYRTFEEQVEAFLEDVGVGFAATKETYYLDFIHGESTAVTGVDTGYGAIRDHVANLAMAAVGYRKRWGMRRNAMVRVYEPDWLIDLIKVDLANDAHLGLNYLNVSDAQVEEVYSSRGLDVCWYNDSATGAGQKFAIPQLAGAINPFPGVVHSYIHHPATFVRLDGGTLDVGLVRDSQLNRQNDLQLFMEEWIGMAKLGNESIDLIDELFPSGAAITEGVEAWAAA